jgi:hypothetical protein
VDDLKVAQFIYLLLRNEKIRDVIDTIGEKGVLILGRFTEERKAVLDAIRDRLRELGFVPMMFDFERATQRDFTETIKTLAGLSRFIVADITNPKSSPLELQAPMPDYMIPFPSFTRIRSHSRCFVTYRINMVIGFSMSWNTIRPRHCARFWTRQWSGLHSSKRTNLSARRRRPYANVI